MYGEFWKDRKSWKYECTLDSNCSKIYVKIVRELTLVLRVDFFLSINYFSDLCGKRRPDQCTVNRYFPGQGIPPHVDNHECCDDTIMSLSLLSDVVMNFTDLESKKMIPVNLPRRSLMVMTGQARYSFR